MKKTTTLSMTESYEKLLKNKYFLREGTYNSLVHKIEDKQISNLYILSESNEVIAKEKTTGDPEFFNEYSITKISPVITDNLVETSTNYNVDTVFVSVPPDRTQTFLAKGFELFNSFFIPFIGLSIVLSIIRNYILMTQYGNSSESKNNMGPFSNPFQSTNDLEKDKINMKKENISLASFGGNPEIFEECMEVVSYLKNATVYKNAGAQIPKGILLEGPPGTGKTLLAKAIASETDANFISVSASEFIEIFVGVGASKIRNLFKKARDNKPCIIFIDEIDAVGKKRGGGVFATNDEREQTLNQLLSEMDGFLTNEDVLVMAATNRKDTLDSALLRPGRFDRIINVPLPDRQSRKSILAVHSKNKKIDDAINFDLLSELTAGFSGAQIKNILNEAAIFTARKGETMIYEKDILDAIEKMVVGLIRKIDTRSEDAIQRVAIHEIGHAFLCFSFREFFDFKKVSIQSTYNGAGGYTLFSEKTDIIESGLYTKDSLKKRLIVAMGGKAAESIFYGEDLISVGAVQDLKQANSIATQMIGNYGMGEELQTFYNENMDPANARGIDIYSEKTKQLFDDESMYLVMEAYTMAKKLLSTHQEQVSRLVDLLKEKTILYESDILPYFLE